MNNYRVRGLRTPITPYVPSPKIALPPSITDRIVTEVERIAYDLNLPEDKVSIPGTINSAHLDPRAHLRTSITTIVEEAAAEFAHHYSLKTQALARDHDHELSSREDIVRSYESKLISKQKLLAARRAEQRNARRHGGGLTSPGVGIGGAGGMATANSLRALTRELQDSRFPDSEEIQESIHSAMGALRDNPVPGLLHKLTLKGFSSAANQAFVENKFMEQLVAQEPDIIESVVEVPGGPFDETTSVSMREDMLRNIILTQEALNWKLWEQNRMQGVKLQSIIDKDSLNKGMHIRELSELVAATKEQFANIVHSVHAAIGSDAEVDPALGCILRMEKALTAMKEVDPKCLTDVENQSQWDEFATAIGNSYEAHRDQGALRGTIKKLRDKITRMYQMIGAKDYSNPYLRPDPTGGLGEDLLPEIEAPMAAAANGESCFLSPQTLTHLSTELGVPDSEIPQDARSRLDYLLDAFQKSKDNYVKLTEDYNAQEATYKTLLEAKGEDIEKKLAEIKALQTALDSAEKKAAGEANKVGKTLAEIAQLKEAFSETEERLEASEGKLEEAEAAKNFLGEQAARFQKELKASEDKVSELEKEVLEKQTDLDDALDKLSKAMERQKKISDSNEEQEKQIATLKAAVSAAADSRKSTQASLTTAQDSLASKKQEIEKLEGDIKNLKKQCDGQATDIKQRTKAIDELEKQSKRYQEQLHNQKLAITENKAKNHTLYTERNDARKESQQLTSTLDHVTAKVQSMEATIKELEAGAPDKKLLASLQDEKANLTSQVASTTKTLQSLQDSLTTDFSGIPNIHQLADPTNTVTLPEKLHETWLTIQQTRADQTFSSWPTNNLAMVVAKDDSPLTDEQNTYNGLLLQHDLLCRIAGKPSPLLTPAISLINAAEDAAKGFSVTAKASARRIATLEGTIEKEKETVKMLTRHVEGQKEAVRVLKSKLQKEEMDLGRAVSQVKSLETKLQDAAAANKTALEEAEKEKQGLQANEKARSEELKKARKELAALQSQQQASRTATANAKIRHNLVSVEVESLKKKIAGLEEKLKDESTEKEALFQANEELEKKTGAAKSEAELANTRHNEGCDPRIQKQAERIEELEKALKAAAASTSSLVPTPASAIGPTVKPDYSTVPLIHEMYTLFLQHADRHSALKLCCKSIRKLLGDREIIATHENEFLTELRSMIQKATQRSMDRSLRAEKLIRRCEHVLVVPDDEEKEETREISLGEAALGFVALVKGDMEDDSELLTHHLQVLETAIANNQTSFDSTLDGIRASLKSFEATIEHYAIEKYTNRLIRPPSLLAPTTIDVDAAKTSETTMAPVLMISGQELEFRAARQLKLNQDNDRRSNLNSSFFYRRYDMAGCASCSGHAVCGCDLVEMYGVCCHMAAESDGCTECGETGETETWYPHLCTHHVDVACKGHCGHLQDRARKMADRIYLETGGFKNQLSRSLTTTISNFKHTFWVLVSPIFLLWQFLGHLHRNSSSLIKFTKPTEKFSPYRPIHHVRYPALYSTAYLLLGIWMLWICWLAKTERHIWQQSNRVTAAYLRDGWMTEKSPYGWTTLGMDMRFTPGYDTLSGAIQTVSAFIPWQS